MDEDERDEWTKMSATNGRRLSECLERVESNP
jgi:hypothetical protein